MHCGFSQADHLESEALKDSPSGRDGSGVKVGMVFVRPYEPVLMRVVTLTAAAALQVLFMVLYREHDLLALLYRRYRTLKNERNKNICEYRRGKRRVD